MSDADEPITTSTTPSSTGSDSVAAPDTVTPAAAPSAAIPVDARPNGVDYDASAITVLEGLEAVRKRPGMYIGSTGPRGLHHLVYEIVDNAVDESLAGYADTIDVTLLADGGVRVKDNGRGIPTDIHPVEKISAVELVLTQLHAGGKFGGGGYKVSGGLHGVGSSVVNALSTRLKAAVRQKGHVFRMSFTDGVPDGPLEQQEATDETGTTITFWANADIFETVDYDFETIRARMQQMAFLNKGLTINLVDERIEQPAGERDVDLDDLDEDLEVVEESTEDDEPQDAAADAGSGEKKTLTAKRVSYRYDNGLVDYVNHINGQQAQRPGAPRGHLHRGRGRGRARSASSSRCSGPTPTASRCTPTPTRSTPTRAAPTRRASARR